MDIHSTETLESSENVNTSSDVTLETSEANIETSEQIFRTKKTNRPKNYSVPEGLKIFLSSIKSEIQDPRNRNQALPNLPDDEIEAMKQLIQLQRERKIVVKASDKGAGIMK